MTYYAASIGPRYGDTQETFVSLKPGVVSTLAARAADYMEEELRACLELDETEEAPEVCAYGESVFYGAECLFTAAELRERRRELMRGKTVVLYRG